MIKILALYMATAHVAPMWFWVCACVCVHVCIWVCVCVYVCVFGLGGGRHSATECTLWEAKPLRHSRTWWCIFSELTVSVCVCVCMCVCACVCLDKSVLLSVWADKLRPRASGQLRPSCRPRLGAYHCWLTPICWWSGPGSPSMSAW